MVLSEKCSAMSLNDQVLTLGVAFSATDVSLSSDSITLRSSRNSKPSVITNSVNKSL